MNTPTISKLYIYPVKSLDWVELNRAEIGIHSLKNDRVFAMKTADDRYVNSKRTGDVHQLQATYDLENKLIHLKKRGTENTETFELRIDNNMLNEYLSDFFKLEIHLVQSDIGELLDVPYQSSATLISTASYQALLQDFPNHSLDDFRLRFRANIEIEGVEAFWEERLFHSPGKAVRFSIGEANMIGMTPRERCNVPPRDPLTGETDKTFVKKIMSSRENSLPDFSNLKAFGNMYHLSIDTYLPPTEAGKTIRIGDEVKIGEVIEL
jgi:uncharacterized protein YcbX